MIVHPTSGMAICPSPSLRQAGALELLSAALQLEDVRCRTWSACAGLRICCGEEAAAKKHRQHAMEVQNLWGPWGI